MHISVARVTTPPTTPPSGPSGAHDPRGLSGKAALVAGGTRGAGRGNAAQLGTAGATVYATGRTSGSERSEPPETDRPETIEETAALVHEASGHGIPSRWTTSYLRRSAH